MEENIVDIVCERIKYDKDKLESGDLQRIEVDSFNLSDFWSQFGAAVQALSNEVTKIGFLCGKEPYPSTEEMSSLMQEVMQYYTVTRDLYLVLPHEVGAEVFKAVTSAMLAIMAALLDILHSLNELTEKGGKERLVLTGAFWEACNAVESLPRNNLTAVMKAVYAEAELAKDALDELTTGKNTGQATDPAWRIASEQKQADQEPEFITNSVTKADLELVEKWVTKQKCWGRPANKKSLLAEIEGIKQLLRWSQDKDNNHLFEGLESLKTSCETLQLDKKIDNLEKIKMVFNSEPKTINNMILLLNGKGTDKDVNSEEAVEDQVKINNKNNDIGNETDKRVEASDLAQLVDISQGIRNDKNNMTAERGRSSLFDKNNMTAERGRSSLFDKNNMTAERGRSSLFDKNNMTAERGRSSLFDKNNMTAKRGRSSLFDKNNMTAKRGRSSLFDKNNMTAERGRSSLFDKNNMTAERGRSSLFDMTRFISLLVEHRRGIVKYPEQNKVKIRQVLTWEYMEDSNRLQQVLPAQQLQRWALRNASIPVIDYLEVKKWVHCQLQAKRLPTVEVLELEITRVSNKLQVCLARGTTAMTGKKKLEFKSNKYDIMTKLTKLLMVKHIFSCNPPEPLFNTKSDTNISSFTERGPMLSSVRASTSESTLTTDALPPPKP